MSADRATARPRRRRHAQLGAEDVAEPGPTQREPPGPVGEPVTAGALTLGVAQAGDEAGVPRLGHRQRRDPHVHRPDGTDPIYGRGVENRA